MRRTGIIRFFGKGDVLIKEAIYYTTEKRSSIIQYMTKPVQKCIYYEIYPHRIYDKKEKEPIVKKTFVRPPAIYSNGTPYGIAKET